MVLIRESISQKCQSNAGPKELDLEPCLSGQSLDAQKRIAFYGALLRAISDTTAR